jgi:hypothetical protein
MNIKNFHEKMARYGLRKEDFKQPGSRVQDSGLRKKEGSGA